IKLFIVKVLLIGIATGSCSVQDARSIKSFQITYIYKLLDGSFFIPKITSFKCSNLALVLLVLFM
ncbi:hypothetical protein AAA075_23520, partial [Bacteroides intestinalis]|uniref:hypothetical protein n=1 Tax=Bacteroides intestinalis TaxID=329854 RepID=UPI0032C0C38E